jgi:hypothetical protein
MTGLLENASRVNRSIRLYMIHSCSFGTVEEKKHLMFGFCTFYARQNRFYLTSLSNEGCLDP